MTTTNAELIAEARKVGLTDSDAPDHNDQHRRLITRLTDALESATTITEGRLDGAARRVWKARSGGLLWSMANDEAQQMCRLFAKAALTEGERR